MRFLIDADLPRDTAVLLASYGHASEDVRDVGMGRAKDPEIAEYARERGSCLLSGDWGFSNIRKFPPQKHHGIVVLGVPDGATGKETLDVLRVLLERPDVIEKLAGRLAVVDKGRIRLRPGL